VHAGYVDWVMVTMGEASPNYTTHNGSGDLCPVVFFPTFISRRRLYMDYLYYVEGLSSQTGMSYNSFCHYLKKYKPEYQFPHKQWCACADCELVFAALRRVESVTKREALLAYLHNHLQKAMRARQDWRAIESKLLLSFAKYESPERVVEAPTD